MYYVKYGYKLIVHLDTNDLEQIFSNELNYRMFMETTRKIATEKYCAFCEFYLDEGSAKLC